MTASNGPVPPGVLSTPEQQLFFIDLLNRNYCAKSHLQERLPEMRGCASFAELEQTITDTALQVNIQISRMDQIFTFLKVQYGFTNCKALIRSIEDAYDAINVAGHDPAMRDLSILAYLQNIEYIGLASFDMLNLAAPLTAQKKIRPLLRENFQEANVDLTVLKRITAKYFKNERSG